LIVLKTSSQRQSASTLTLRLSLWPRCSTSSPVSPEGATALPMPLPKSLLRRPVRRTSTSSSTGQSQRQRCRTCNNLDPRGHASSIYPDDHEKDSKARLTLSIDALSLSKTKDVAQRGCRFCNAIIQSLDTFFENWRGSRIRINIEIREKATIKVSLDGETWKGEVIEIYAGSGRQKSHFLHATQSNPATGICSTHPNVDIARLLLILAYLLVIHLTSFSVPCSMAYTGYCTSYTHRLWVGRDFQLHPQMHTRMRGESKTHCMQVFLQIVHLSP
jgi:hypothetical protein